MTQPITSKLAIVANIMDEYTRLENNAHLANAVEQGRQISYLTEERSAILFNLNRALARINELEQDLRMAFDHNERLVEQVYTLEVSILDCPSHDFRFASDQEREQWVAAFAPIAAYAPNHEMIDLTSDEELESDN